jgi:hypothetical protein
MSNPGLDGGAITMDDVETCAHVVTILIDGTDWDPTLACSSCGLTMAESSWLNVGGRRVVIGLPLSYAAGA